jgi:hypothetical protein
MKNFMETSQSIVKFLIVSVGMDHFSQALPPVLHWTAKL